MVADFANSNRFKEKRNHEVEDVIPTGDLI